LGNLSWGGGTTERVFDFIAAFKTFTSTITGAKIEQPFLGWRCRKKDTGMQSTEAAKSDEGMQSTQSGNKRRRHSNHTGGN
jgi:hypothetical protein